MTNKQNKEATQNLGDRLNEMVPFLISEVLVQVHDTSRVSVFSDGEFLFGISLFECQRLGLYKGKEVDAHLAKQISVSVNQDYIKQWLLGLLGKRPYSRFEILQKSRKKGFSSSDVTPLLDQFESRGWINDEEFARMYASDQARLRGYGPQKIRANLMQKGVSDLVINTVLNEVHSDIDLESVFQKLVLKKKNHFLRENDTFKRKKKVVDYLLRKGFHGNDVFKHIDHLLKELST